MKPTDLRRGIGLYLAILLVILLLAVVLDHYLDEELRDSARMMLAVAGLITILAVSATGRLTAERHARPAPPKSHGRDEDNHKHRDNHVWIIASVGVVAMAVLWGVFIDMGLSADDPAVRSMAFFMIPFSSSFLATGAVWFLQYGKNGSQPQRGRRRLGAALVLLGACHVGVLGIPAAALYAFDGSVTLTRYWDSVFPVFVVFPWIPMAILLWVTRSRHAST
jgi:hypothetical protein